MIELFELNSGGRMLEIGASCGFQITVSAHILAVEFIMELQAEACDRLRAFRSNNISFRLGDGRQSWAREAPFDTIITDVPGTLSPALTAQLATGGRFLVPPGRQHETQFLTCILRREDGKLSEKRGLPVAFVPLVKIDECFWRTRLAFECWKPLYICHVRSIYKTAQHRRSIDRVPAKLGTVEAPRPATNRRWPSVRTNL
jgi:protein-L-isoaspartate(D-aspartate) O-methyltransferase